MPISKNSPSNLFCFNPWLDASKIIWSIFLSVRSLIILLNFMGSKDGLVHISQLKNERVEKVSDVINEGDIVKVKVLDVDGRGKVKLSMKEVEAE